jgi:hypothetical protein
MANILILSKDNSWVILSPGRTGGRLLSLLIVQAYQSEGIKLKESYPEDSELRKIKPSELCHTHDPHLINFVNKNTRLVINTRNIIDIALSWFKTQQINTYDHQTYLDLKKSIPKFNLDINEFKKIIGETVSWHRTVSAYDPECICIDYSDFENNPENIYKILDIETPKDFYIPLLKTPGSHSDWIENWEEIKQFIDRNPQLNCPPQMEFFLKNKRIAA